MNEITTEELQLVGATPLPLELQLPDGMSKQDWANIGRRLVRSIQVFQWWVGDWAAFGVRKYGDLKEFAEFNGVNYGTLRDLAWVSGAVEVSRRRDNVEWSKHREVAALPAKEQSQWLEKAASLSVADLRREIRQAHGSQNALEPDGPVIKYQASEWLDKLTRWLEDQPAEFWTPGVRETWNRRWSVVHEVINRPRS